MTDFPLFIPTWKAGAIWGTKAAPGAHLSTSHKIQQYLWPTSENICRLSRKYLSNICGGNIFWKIFTQSMPSSDLIWNLLEFWNFYWSFPCMLGSLPPFFWERALMRAKHKVICWSLTHLSKQIAKWCIFLKVTVAKYVVVICWSLTHLSEQIFETSFF